VAAKAIGVVLLLFLLSTVVSSATLEYTVTYTKGAPTVHVEAVVTGLKASSVDLVFRAEASYVSEHVLNLTTSEGPPSSEDEGRWRVALSGDRLSYAYNVDRVVRWHPNIPWGTSNDVAIYFDDQCGIFMAPYMFIYPVLDGYAEIRVSFEVPDSWHVITPYDSDGNDWVVHAATGDRLASFLLTQGIYMGEMPFSSEFQVGACTVRFGKLPCDDELWISTQADVDQYVQAAAKSMEALRGLFGDNPYHAFVLYTNFRRSVSATQELYYQGGRYMGNALQHWPEHRWDELVGHMALAWCSWSTVHPSPLRADRTIEKGILEDYYGHILAWEAFQDEAYLGKIYQYYLMYEWMTDHHDRPPSSYVTQMDEYDAYLRWEFIGLLLDAEIQRRSALRFSLADVIRWLYKLYAFTDHVVSPSDLELETMVSTGIDVSDLFRNYVYQDRLLPVYDLISSYRSHFEAYPAIMAETRYRDDLCGHVVPLFIDMVLAASLSSHLAWGIHGERYNVQFADRIFETFSIDSLTEADVVDVLSDMSGTDCSKFFTHWEDSYGVLTIEDVRAWLTAYRDHLTALQRPVLPPESASSAVCRIDPERFAFPIDGATEVGWDDLARHLTDQEGDTDQAGADIVAVCAYSDGEYLYVRVDVADDAPAPSNIAYTIGVTALNYTPPGPGPSTLRNISSTEAIFESGYGTSNLIAFASDEVVEFAFPLEWLGACDYAKIRCETRSMDEESNTRYDYTRTFEIHFGSL